MKVLGLALLTTVACGGAKPPEPLENVAVILPPPAPERPRVVAAPRPALDLAAILPDPTEQARWPLSVAAHPALEPRFNIAGALAEPGLGWIELCRMGAQNRTLSSGRDLQSYLKAWCAAANGNTADAFNQLVVIGNPTVSGMALAVREDLANILVQNGDADAAEKLLMKAKVEDIEIFDLLAASYFEIGKNADAHEINERAIDRQLKSSDAAKCHRYARRIILLHPSSRALYMTELDDLGNEAKRSANKIGTDPECKHLDVELACWTLPAMHCRDYLIAQNLDADRYQALIETYYEWPTVAATYGVWAGLADKADRAQPLPGAARLELAALVAAFGTVKCQNTYGLGEIGRMSKALRAEPARDTSMDATLDQLITLTTVMANSLKNCEANEWSLR